jgi:hypothetical protein
MNTIYDTTDTNSVLQLAWPLPGTMLPHAHQTWDGWVTRTAGGEPDSIRYLVSPPFPKSSITLR